MAAAQFHWGDVPHGVVDATQWIARNTEIAIAISAQDAALVASRSGSSGHAVWLTAAQRDAERVLIVPIVAGAQGEHQDVFKVVPAP